MGNSANPITQPELDKLLAKYDKDNNGLDLDEAKQLAEEVRKREGLAKPLPDETISKLFHKLDKSGDGTISKQEFNGMFALLQQQREAKKKKDGSAATGDDAKAKAKAQPASDDAKAKAKAQPASGNAGNNAQAKAQPAPTNAPRSDQAKTGASNTAEQNAATKIQAIQRGNAARKETGAKKDEKNQQVASNLKNGSKPKSKPKPKVKPKPKPKPVQQGLISPEEAASLPVSDKHSWAAQLRSADWKLTSVKGETDRSADHFRRGALLRKDDQTVKLMRTTDIANHPPDYDSEQEDVESEGSAESISGEITRHWDPTRRDPRYTYARDNSAKFSEGWTALNWTREDWEEHLVKTGAKFTKPTSKRDGLQPGERMTPYLMPQRGVKSPRNAIVQRAYLAKPGIHAVRPEIYESTFVEPKKELVVGHISRKIDYEEPDPRSATQELRELAVQRAIHQSRQQTKQEMVFENDITFSTGRSSEYWAEDDEFEVAEWTNTVNLQGRGWL